MSLQSQLVTKLKDFTAANLKAFLDNSPAAELKQAIKEYAPPFPPSWPPLVQSARSLRAHQAHS